MKMSREQLLLKMSLKAGWVGFVPQKKKREVFSYYFIKNLLIHWFNLPEF